MTAAGAIYLQLPVSASSHTRRGFTEIPLQAGSQKRLRPLGSQGAPSSRRRLKHPSLPQDQGPERCVKYKPDQTTTFLTPWPVSKGRTEGERPGRSPAVPAP